MRVRPFDSERFLVDIDRGDILAESGQLLVIGKPKGLRATGHDFDNPVFWEPAGLSGYPNRQIQRYTRGDLSWTTLYSFPYRPRCRTRLPESPNDLAALHYTLLKLEFERFLHGTLRKCKILGDAKLGLVPLSWRKPSVVAHAMAEALAGLFGCFRHQPEPRTLTVVIRSLDEPDELLGVFDRAYFREWRSRLRYSPNNRDIWFPA